MPLVTFTPEEEAFVCTQQIARLSTVDRQGQPHLVPICFTYLAGNFYSAIDAKPKRVAPQQLKRIKNILTNPHVALLLDEYNADWSRLRYLLISGEATLLTEGGEYAEAIQALRQKYPQYVQLPLVAGEAPVIKILPVRKHRWGRW